MHLYLCIVGNLIHPILLNEDLKKDTKGMRLSTREKAMAIAFIFGDAKSPEPPPINAINVARIQFCLAAERIFTFRREYIENT